MTKIKKGDLVLVYFHDHSYQPRGEKKDTKVLDMYVTGRVKSTRGKQLIIEMWFLDDKDYQHNAELAKILKSAIINTWRLKIQ